MPPDCLVVSFVQEESTMKRINFTLTDYAQVAHVPLAAFGYALRRAGILEPLRQVNLPIKTHLHTPGDKLIEALVLTLAGGRSTAQIDLWLRPNRALAQAWGQVQFAEQATVSRTLDAFEASSIASLREAFEIMLKHNSSVLQHDFRTGALWLDADLSGLPASHCAQGSTKGYFAGEKTVSDANSPA
jgi:hypothetical protein